MRNHVVVFLLFWATSSYSQFRNLKFDHIGLEQGLSQSTVTCILQDSQGFMWFGTLGGLHKYDGYNFTVYKNDFEDENTIAHERINDIAEDADGNLWIATYGGGLDMLDWKKGKFTHYKHDPNDSTSIPNNRLHTLKFDNEGNLWIGTAGSGLCMFDKSSNKFIQYQHDIHDAGSISGNSINHIIVGHEENLWVTTVANGVNVFDKKTKRFKHHRHNPNIPGSIVSNNTEVLFVDSKDQLWVGTRNGLDKYDKERDAFKHYTVASPVVLSLQEDDSGNLWVGTENGGISMLNLATEESQNYVQDDIDRMSLNSNSIWSLYKDNVGDMWVGTFNGGINFVRNNANKFNHYRHTSSPQSLSNNGVWEIFEDSENNIWIGTDGGGLNLFDRKKGVFTSYVHNKTSRSISGNYVLSISEDKHHNLWVGTWGLGVTVINRKQNTFKHFKYSPDDTSGISSPNAWTLFKDSKGNMWVGTYSNGADLYDEKTDSFIHYRHDPKNPLSISSSTINQFYEDSKGNLWICTATGLNIFDRECQTFTSFLHKADANSISNDRVVCIREDSKGNYWIGTELGLNYLDSKTKKFTPYFVKNGLPGNSIFAILLDEDNLWISTNNGLSFFDTHTNSFKNFAIYDGLQSAEFKKAACKSSSGEFYFGGTNGFNEFSPDKMASLPFEPPLVLTGFDVFNKPVPISSDPDLKLKISQSISLTDEIHLTYEHNVFSIQFASLNYASPERRRYSYRLEGFDKEWTSLSPVNHVTYTNLDPGSYTFKVQGLNNTGERSGRMLELKINITPPIWGTWWFKALAILTIGFSVILVFIIRTNGIRRRNKELEEAVDDKTKEIQDSYRLLAEQQEELAAQNEELVQSQEQASSQRDLLYQQNLELNEAKRLIEKQNENLEEEVSNRTRELVDYNHQLEQFAFIAAHNLRAPVARILGLGQLLDFKNSMDDKDQIYPRLINTTKELDNVVKDLNTILELRRNNDSFISDVELEEEIHMIKRNLESEISSSHAEIKHDFSEAASIRTVKPYLDSILYNLISNAIKYRHPQRLPIIQVSTLKSGKEICLCVKDNGLGIDVSSYQEKIFTLYSRFHSHVEGKGMGLYLVKTQMLALGGRVELESVVDKGSTFRLYFKG